MVEHWPLAAYDEWPLIGAFELMPFCSLLAFGTKQLFVDACWHCDCGYVVFLRSCHCDLCKNNAINSNKMFHERANDRSQRLTKHEKLKAPKNSGFYQGFWQATLIILSLMMQHKATQEKHDWVRYCDKCYPNSHSVDEIYWYAYWHLTLWRLLVLEAVKIERKRVTV